MADEQICLNFVSFFCHANGCGADEIVTRIEFEYPTASEMKATAEVKV